MPFIDPEGEQNGTEQRACWMGTNLMNKREKDDFELICNVGVVDCEVVLQHLNVASDKLRNGENKGEKTFHQIKINTLICRFH